MLLPFSLPLGVSGWLLFSVYLLSSNFKYLCTLCADYVEYGKLMPCSGVITGVSSRVCISNQVGINFSQLLKYFRINKLTKKNWFDRFSDLYIN